MTILLAALLVAAVPPSTVPSPRNAPAAASARAPVVRPTEAQVMSAVRAEWPKYDGGNKGRLTPLEFSTWVMRSHGGTVAQRSHGKGIAPVSAMNAASAAFARADLNHDGGVTPEEMTHFLMGPTSRKTPSPHAAVVGTKG